MQTESRDAVGGRRQVQGREHLLSAGLYIDRIAFPLRALARGVSNDAVDPRRPWKSRQRAACGPLVSSWHVMPPARRGDSSINGKYAFHDRDKNFRSRCIRFNYNNALLALSCYRDGGDW